MASTVEKVKSQLPIVEVVGSYIKLTKAGGNFKAKCPFHNEKTPSFFVSPSRDSYHCFGCDRGGDIFSFIQEIEGVEFYESLKILSNKAGIEIVAENSKDKNEKEKSLEILENTVQFYENNLKEKKDVLKYLKDRGLTSKTLEKFRVGFSLDSWRELLEYLSKKNISSNLLEKTGLIIKSKNKKGDEIIYDRFRSRIMFPIEDSAGRVIGFSGRVFGGSEDQAKYINSPQTLLFDKSQALYGYSQAKEGIRKLYFCIITEGQIDVLMSHQAGFINTVAVSGTALTIGHIRLIKRLTENIVFAFDRDPAGLSALKRAAILALSQDINVKVALIPSGKDPADLVRENPELWKKSIKGSIHIIEYLIHHYRKSEKDDRKYKLIVTKEVIPLVYNIQNKIDQSHFISFIAKKLNVPDESVYSEFKRSAIKIEVPQFEENEKDKKLPNIKQSRLYLIIEQLIGLYIWQTGETKKIHNYEFIIEKLNNFIPERDYNKYIHELSNEMKSKLVFEAELCYKNSDKIDKIVSDLFINLEMELINNILIEKINIEKDTESQNNKKGNKNIKKAIQDLINKRNSLKNNLS